MKIMLWNQQYNFTFRLPTREQVTTVRSRETGVSVPTGAPAPPLHLQHVPYGESPEHSLWRRRCPRPVQGPSPRHGQMPLVPACAASRWLPLHPFKPHHKAFPYSGVNAAKGLKSFFFFLNKYVVPLELLPGYLGQIKVSSCQAKRTLSNYEFGSMNIKLNHGIFKIYLGFSF